MVGWSGVRGYQGRGVTELLEKAQPASGAGITQTVRIGPQLLAASQAYDKLRRFRGYVCFTRTLAELKADR